MPCPAESLTLPLFLVTRLHERKWSPRHCDAGNETNLHPSAGRLVLCTSTALCFLFTHTETEILQTAVPGPQRGVGGGDELRTECEFISSWQARWEKSHAAVHAALTRPLNLLPACPKQEVFVYMPSKQEAILNVINSLKSFLKI